MLWEEKLGSHWLKTSKVQKQGGQNMLWEEKLGSHWRKTSKMQNRSMCEMHCNISWTLELSYLAAVRVSSPNSIMSKPKNHLLPAGSGQ